MAAPSPPENMRTIAREAKGSGNKTTPVDEVQDTASNVVDGVQDTASEIVDGVAGVFGLDP